MRDSGPPIGADQGRLGSQTADFGIWENQCVFTRLRRGDLVLAAVALVGVAAGLTLTIAQKIGVTGPALIGVGVMAAVAVAAPAARGQLAALIGRTESTAESP